jgi:SAM-dependent methyltransferase
MSESRVRNFFAHPLTRGLDIDSPETTQLRREIIQAKAFLRKIYLEWYAFVLQEAGEAKGVLLELGSGAGFLGEQSKDVITSDLFLVDGANVVLDGQHLPLKDGSIKALAMVNVLHHVPEPEKLLKEAARCVKSQGKFIMIEPWMTTWSRFVYKRLHHEPVDETSKEWTIHGQGPLSGANSALPWIIFQRDRELFKRKFPMWQIAAVSPFMPFRYLLSGGVSLRSLMFASAFGFWRGIENMLKPWMNNLAMFAKIVLVRE